MSALASLRVSAKCPQCELPLLMPECSECTNQRTVHFWHCPICGQNFQTVDRTRTKPAPDEQRVALVA